jgi:mRNA-degrading endonuclease RelE of RelBE toxin-antitoxin system
MKRRVEFTDAALKILAVAKNADRRFILDDIKSHLIENDPLAVTRNKFLLRRPSIHAERKLRLDNWRVFYRVMDNADLVIVNLIGEKQGDKLISHGEEIEL